MSGDVAKGSRIILESAFGQSLIMANPVAKPHISHVQVEVIERLFYRSSMATISCGYFRLIMMLHFPRFKARKHSIISSLESADSLDAEDKYLDLMSEVSNKLCGGSCAILEENHYSSGMTTPNILGIPKATHHMASLRAISQHHVGSYVNDNPFLMASLFVVSNIGHEDTLDINITSNHQSEIVHSGELELF